MPQVGTPSVRESVGGVGSDSGRSRTEPIRSRRNIESRPHQRPPPVDPGVEGDGDAPVPGLCAAVGVNPRRDIDPGNSEFALDAVDVDLELVSAVLLVGHGSRPVSNPLLLAPFC